MRAVSNRATARTSYTTCESLGLLYLVTPSGASFRRKRPSAYQSKTIASPSGSLALHIISAESPTGTTDGATLAPLMTGSRFWGGAVGFEESQAPLSAKTAMQLASTLRLSMRVAYDWAQRTDRGGTGSIASWMDDERYERGREPSSMISYRRLDPRSADCGWSE